MNKEITKISYEMGYLAKEYTKAEKDLLKAIGGLPNAYKTCPCVEPQIIELIDSNLIEPQIIKVCLKCGGEL